MEFWPIGFRRKRLSLPSWKETLPLIGVFHSGALIKGEIMRKIIFFVTFSILLFGKTIYLASAANLTYVMPDIIKAFNEKYPNVKVDLVLSSSGKLTAQILGGAPFDIFLSANMKYPLKLYKSGFGKIPPKIYAKGAICLFSLKYKNLSIKNLDKFNTIAISKPKTTPYGAAAVEAFKNAKIYNKIKNKLVYAETIPAVFSYVKSYADVGVVAKSTLFSKNVKSLGKFYYKEINPKLYSPIKQGALLLSNKKEAKEFFNFLFSKKAREIFKKYGYN